MSTLMFDSKDKLASESASWAARARDLKIVDRESCVNASTLLRSVKTFRNQIQLWFAPHIERAMEVKRKAEDGRKALADERDKMEAPLVAAETSLKAALLAWDVEQEQVRIEEERRLQAEAQAEAERVTLEAAAAMETAAREADDPAMLEEAKAILAQPIVAEPVYVPSQAPKVAGVSKPGDHWKARPTVDVKALAAAVASGKAPVTFLQPNMTAINAFGRATKGTQAIDGVTWYNDRTIAVRG